MPQQSQLNHHQHMHGPATIASSSGSNNSIASFQLQLHLGLSIPASGQARPSQTRLGPHAAHAASAIKCKLFHFCANCCATFFSGSVRAHHQKQIIDSSSSSSKIDSKEKTVAEVRGRWNCRNCCSIFAFIDFSCSQRR